MWKTVLAYGVALALVATALQWLQYQALARSRPGEIYIALIGAAFLALGVWVGVRVAQRRATGTSFEPNTKARAALAITDREFEVLELLAAGRSNKEIAQKLEVSPNTVKTHVARLFEKLEASRRTEAILKARELGLIP